MLSDRGDESTRNGGVDRTMANEMLLKEERQEKTVEGSEVWLAGTKR